MLLDKIMRKSFLFIMFLLLGAIGVSAQDAFLSSNTGVTSSSEATIDNSIFMDEDERICYVDLEKVPFVLTQAVIINKDGDEVLRKSLKEEKVDTIVELSYGELPAGAYLLELRSYNNKAVKALQL